MENDLKGNENWFELVRGSSKRGFELSYFKMTGSVKIGVCIR